MYCILGFLFSRISLLALFFLRLCVVSVICLLGVGMCLCLVLVCFCVVCGDRLVFWICLWVILWGVFWLLLVCVLLLSVLCVCCVLGWLWWLIVNLCGFVVCEKFVCVLLLMVMVVICVCDEVWWCVSDDVWVNVMMGVIDVMMWVMVCVVMLMMGSVMWRMWLGCVMCFLNWLCDDVGVNEMWGGCVVVCVGVRLGVGNWLYNFLVGLVMLLLDVFEEI